MQNAASSLVLKQFDRCEQHLILELKYLQFTLALVRFLSDRSHRSSFWT